MKKILPIVIYIGLFIGIFLLINSSENSKTSVEQSYFTSPLIVSGDITCTFPQTLYVSYLRDTITHELSKAETSPLIFTFSDIANESSKIKFIDATRTISEAPLIKIADNSEKLIFIEGTGDPYLTIHTIYKESGVATYSKQNSLMGIPVGTLAMGTCIDS